MRLSPSVQNVIRQLLILAIPLVASPVSSLKCEICSSEDMKDGLASIKLQFPNLNSVPSCGPKAQFLDCPDGYQAGCLTQTKGKHVSKMCSNIPVQDCQVANSVEYCYCRGELCNKQPQSNQVPKATVTRRPPPAAIPTNPTTTRAPKSASRPRDSDNDWRAHDLHQSTTKPDDLSPASGAVSQGWGPRLLAGAALALMVCRHILTPNII